VGRSSQEFPAESTPSETIELVRAAQRGCRASFDQLAQRFEQRIFVIAFHQLRNFHDAEDATQEVLIEVFEHLPSLQNPARFEAWLKKLARNRALDRLRRKLNVESCVESHEDLAQSAPLSAKLPNDAFSVPDLSSAMNTLSPALRETLDLHYFQNCSLKEISARLGVPLNTVKRRLHDARQKLRESSAQKIFEKSSIAPNLRGSAFDMTVENVEQTN
jgi:RNA polymerase sigma factor (sigma-70 family)